MGKESMHDGQDARRVGDSQTADRRGGREITAQAWVVEQAPQRRGRIGVARRHQQAARGVGPSRPLRRNRM